MDEMDEMDKMEEVGELKLRRLCWRRFLILAVHQPDRFQDDVAGNLQAAWA